MFVCRAHALVCVCAYVFVYCHKIERQIRVRLQSFGDIAWIGYSGFLVKAFMALENNIVLIIYTIL